MINIELSPESKAALKKIFKGQSGFAEEELAKIVANLAFDEWMGWISGQNRYSSLTEQSVERITDIFSEIMPGREPDINFLYNVLNIPYGKARYIVQVIAERQLSELNKIAIELLISLLSAKSSEVSAMSPSERKTKYVNFEISNKRASRILIMAIDTLPPGKKPIDGLKVAPSPLKDTKFFELKASYVDDVLNAVKQMKGGI